jgi:hypothetical protein
LRQYQQGLDELFRHHTQREGERGRPVLHFYCDANGFVTIGYGYCADSRSPGVGERLARALSSRSDVEFSDRLGRPVSRNAVLEDWRRVKAAFPEKGGAGTPCRPPPGAGTYGSVAKLRIKSQSAVNLWRAKVDELITVLYRKRPFASDLAFPIQMAIVDAQYNPSGVVVFGKDSTIKRFWAALDPKCRNLELAATLFERIWKNRGGENRKIKERYQQRHQIRVRWFREGVAEMEKEAPPLQPPVEDER